MQPRNVSFVEDNRPLPIPEPGDRHSRVPPPSGRYDRSWTWGSWKEWLHRCWDRTHWKKKDINKVLGLRNSDPANKDEDWRHAARDFNRCGGIYAIYHFTTGRWYVGQTVNQLWQRAQHHWHSRLREDDLFHDALSTDPNPFALVVLPLEWIPQDKYAPPETPRQDAVRNFRRLATPRERYWVGKLNSMWPYGWNSALPGKPVTKWVQRQHQPQCQGSSMSQESH